MEGGDESRCKHHTTETPRGVHGSPATQTMMKDRQPAQCVSKGAPTVLLITSFFQRCFCPNEPSLHPYLHLHLHSQLQPHPRYPVKNTILRTPNFSSSMSAQPFRSPRPQQDQIERRPAVPSPSPPSQPDAEWTAESPRIDEFRGRNGRRKEIRHQQVGPELAFWTSFLLARNSLLTRTSYPAHTLHSNSQHLHIAFCPPLHRFLLLATIVILLLPPLVSSYQRSSTLPSLLPSPYPLRSFCLYCGLRTALGKQGYPPRR